MSYADDDFEAYGRYEKFPPPELRRDYAAEVRREREAARVLATEFRGDATDMALALLALRDVADLATQRAEAAAVERDHYMLIGIQRLERIEALEAERDALRKAVERWKAQLVRVVGDHVAPDDCYATGPLTGNAYVDLIACPSCEANAMIAESAALAVQPTTEGG